MAIITRATATDADALDRLVNSAYRGEESKKGWTTEADLLDGTRIDAEALRDLIARPGTVVLMYKEDHELLGCVELRKDYDRLYLGMLSVRPATQGRGVGKALLKAAEDHARTVGCKAIYMTVISGRGELINWYLRHGYLLTGERKPFVVPDVRWGIPKQPLEFVVLEKQV
jgi:ribosomal protein S18 acetylase RimI-like enzyme